MQLPDIQQAVLDWNTARATFSSALQYLHQGKYFMIGIDLYNAWNNNPKPTFIHVYLGIHNNELTTFLIDDISDGQPITSSDNIYKSDIHSDIILTQPIPRFQDTDPTGHINILTGLERFFRWHLQRKDWVQANISKQYPGFPGEGIFQVFNIPMSDLDAMFEDVNGSPKNQNTMAVIGLRDDLVVELVLWGDNFSSVETVADVSFPVPPFKPPHQVGNYQLLNQSGAAPIP